ncbi:hypothetical protein OROMI_004075 [Orobanche minor]
MEEIHKKLGYGGTREVKRVSIAGSDKMMVAIKSPLDHFKTNGLATAMSQLERERRYVSMCKHKNIIKLFGYSYSRDKSKLSLVYEYMPKTSVLKSFRENSNTNIPKAISGWVPKSKSTAATGSLPRDEATEIYELINIHKKVDERIQKLHETLEDGSRMSIRNTSSRGTRNDTGMNESVVAYQELRDKTEIQAIQLQKLHEKLEEFLDQTMRKHEDMVGMIEAKKIPRKKEWSGNADLCTMKDLEELTDKGKWKLNSTGAETKDVLVKIWDEKVDIIDDGIVVKEEVKFLADDSCDHPNLPKLISFCNNG